MDKNKILEIVFKTIKDSTEWGIENEDKSYGNWVDGCIALASNLIDEIDKADCNINNYQNGVM